MIRKEGICDLSDTLFLIQNIWQMQHNRFESKYSSKIYCRSNNESRSHVVILRDAEYQRLQYSLTYTHYPNFVRL